MPDSCLCSGLVVRCAMASPLPVVGDPIRVSLESLRRLVVFKALAKVSDVLSTVSRAMFERKFGPSWVE